MDRPSACWEITTVLLYDEYLDGEYKCRGFRSHVDLHVYDIQIYKVDIWFDTGFGPVEGRILRISDNQVDDHGIFDFLSQSDPWSDECTRLVIRLRRPHPLPLVTGLEDQPETSIGLSLSLGVWFSSRDSRPFPRKGRFYGVIFFRP